MNQEQNPGLVDSSMTLSFICKHCHKSEAVWQGHGDRKMFKPKASYTLSKDQRKFHPHQALREIGKIIKKQFGGSWIVWNEVPQEVNDSWFSKV
ncbi:uncharacterized protein G2W53_007244 [Senna tora]|uniref:Uncharacterized protein n=1 Tax=Senna tora TaxID=362788 RepID=A0A834X5S4_9FABA|nr:uncharacterized protein G2W53_007244 [Senna tora]